MKLQLFKYYSPKYKNTWNLAFYEKRKIFFQQPINFNDPWDCELPSLSIPSQQNLLKEVLFHITRPNGSEYSSEEWERIKSLPSSQIKEKFRQLFEVAFKQLRTNIGVFSTSCIPDSELLWSHYCNGHKGYSLHFEIDLLEYNKSSKLSETAFFIPVEYTDSRREWNLEEYYCEKIKHIKNLIRYKSNAWKYEHEVRLLNGNNYGFIKFPDEWIKGIVVGLAAEEELKSRLVVAGKELNIPVYFATMDEAQYRVNIPGLNINGKLGEKHYQKIICSDVFKSK